MSESDPFSHLRSDFETYYNNKLWPKLFAIEEKRIKYLHRFWVLFIIVGMWLPALLLWVGGEWLRHIFTEGSSKDVEGVLKLGALIASVIIAIVSSPIVSYKLAVKDTIINDFINFFGDFRHSLTRQILDATIKKSLLLNNYNRHDTDDYFYGTYKNVSMVISEEKMIRKGNKNQSTVFKGIMVLLKFPKSFSGRTVVFKDWGHLNFLHTTDKNFERVALEDVVFEKEFEVYGTDQIEARFLLTTAFMERMLHVRETFKGRKIQFSFFDNQLLIAIDTSKDMFEPASLFKSSTDRRPVNDVLEQFISIFAIVEFLKLTQQ